MTNGPVERGRGAQDRVAEPERPRLVDAHHLGPARVGEVRREGAAPAPGHEHHALDAARLELVDDVLHHGPPRHRQQPLRHAARERAQSGRQPGDRHDGGGDGHGRREASARVVLARVRCCAALTASSRGRGVAVAGALRRCCASGLVAGTAGAEFLRTSSAFRNACAGPRGRTSVFPRLQGVGPTFDARGLQRCCETHAIAPPRRTRLRTTTRAAEPPHPPFPLGDAVRAQRAAQRR